ncbi:MAG: transposase, partial [Clostridia bacterium]|nr:transposase [Clostridia bacterium]
HDVKLGTKVWICPVCGAVLDRDVNAAINIREKGKEVFVQYFLQELQEEQSSRARAAKLSEARKHKKGNQAVQNALA